MIINYIKNQREHRKKETFYDEFKRLLWKMVLNLTKNICSKLLHSTLSGLCRSPAFLPPTLLGAIQIKPHSGYFIAYVSELTAMVCHQPESYV